ncbi:hypothetical protein GS489_31625 [Rhodococcus hoagii]|nr:hypothetical protein [Prescottella equi]
MSAADRLEDWASAADKIAVVVADVLGSTCPPDAFHRSGDASEVELQVWADGKLGEALEVFEILAAHGATWEIEAVGEDYSRWRWRWADGVVHDESARTIYDGQVDTEGWVVQMQSLDDHDFDHIALVACEAAGKVLIAQWCRDEYAAHPELHGHCPAPDGDEDAVIDAWTNAIGGVRYRVSPVNAATWAPAPGATAQMAETGDLGG